MKAITVYVVDDYLLTRIAHKRYFASDEDFVILGDFSNAKDCIEAMKTQEADIILLDIELPDMNGIEALKILKEKFPSTKIVMFTSFKNKQRVIASLAYGAHGYILKNNQNTNLKNILKMVAKGEIWLDCEIAKYVLSSMPKPNSLDLNNLYENKDLKNSLTLRELEVLKLLIEGKTNSQIAKEIIISTNTAKAHVGNILAKLSVKDRVQAAVKAVRANIF